MSSSRKILIGKMEKAKSNFSKFQTLQIDRCQRPVIVHLPTIDNKHKRNRSYDD